MLTFRKHCFISRLKEPTLQIHGGIKVLPPIAASCLQLPLLRRTAPTSVVGPRALRSPQQHQGGHTGHSLSRWPGPAGGGAHALAFPAAPTGAHGEAELHQEQRSHLALSADLCRTDDGGEAAGSKGLQFYRGLQEKSREEHRGDSASGGNMSTEPDPAGLPGAR